jgi:hypothetical protein
MNGYQDEDEDMALATGIVNVVLVTAIAAAIIAVILLAAR